MNKKKKGYAMGGKTAMKKKGYAAGGALKTPSAGQKGLKKLPKPVRNKMGYMAKGGMTTKKKGYAMGGMTGAYDPVQADMQRQQGMMQAQQPKPAMKNGGMMKKKKMTGAYDPVQADMQRQQGMMQAQQPKPAMKNGGMMKKKKGYAKGGKVMTYNLGGMVKAQTDNRKKNNKK